MTELDLEHPELAELGATQSTLDQQAELVSLELYYRRRQLFGDPGLIKLTVGLGQQAERTIRGHQDDPYNGVVIFNPTPATLSVGFQAGTGLLAPATVPPFSWCTFSERYVNLSIALNNPADQQTTITLPVTIMRTRVPPPPGAGAFGNPAQTPAAVALNPASAATIGVAGTASVIAANPARHELTIVNVSAAGNVTLGLGPNIPVLFAGITLFPNGAYQTAAYQGPVSMIASANGTQVGIAEV